MYRWMTEERREITRRYIYDMINSFVEDPETGNAHLDTTPQTVSFYSPDFEFLLRYICHQDSYAVKHSDLKLLYYHSNEKYDIDGHCVDALNGTIDIRIDGVAFDQAEIDEFMRGYKKGLEEEAKEKEKKSKISFVTPKLRSYPVNKFHVRLPPK